MLSFQLGTARLIEAIDRLGVTSMPIQTSSLSAKHHQADTSLPLAWKLSQCCFLPQTSATCPVSYTALKYFLSLSLNTWLG